MSSEQNVPEVQTHQGPPPATQMGDQMGQNVSAQDAHGIPHGMGQSKSSRRRRRKRKSKSAEPGQAGAVGQFVGDVQANGQGFASPPAQPQNFQPGAAQQQGAAPSTKRWKKKFRDRDRQRPPENPGNQAAASGFSNGNGAGYRDKDTHQPGNSVGGFKRKGKQRERGPRSFVGPMDHSYRVANGNFADAPPSTIETHGNYQGRGGGGRGYVSDSQPIDYSVGRTIPIPEDAPTKIFFFIEDLFLNAKINETARTLTLIPKLKAKLKKSTSIVGFLSHLQGDLKAKAVEAGCDAVMPRAAFSQNLPNLLRRYGIQAEEEESNFNQ
jgi:hypothetical protein